MRRFKRKCEKSGILSELKKRQHYEKPSAKRKAQDDSGSQENAPQTLGGEASDTLTAGTGGGADREGLEFGVVLRLISALSRTPPGRAAVLSLAPSHDETEVRRLPRRDRRGDRVPDPPRPAPPGGPGGDRRLSRRARGLGGRGLARGVPTRSCARRARPRPCARPSRKPIPRTSPPGATGSPLSTRCSLRRRASSAPTGSSRTTRRPQLAAIRQRLRRRRGEVSRLLEKLLDERRDSLGDAVVVLRNDRYCLPVQASARARVPGIVHDRSGSGQTVFVEPMEVIESNNDLALAFGGGAPGGRAAPAGVRPGDPRERRAR